MRSVSPVATRPSANGFAAMTTIAAAATKSTVTRARRWRCSRVAMSAATPISSGSPRPSRVTRHRYAPKSASRTTASYQAIDRVSGIRNA